MSTKRRTSGRSLQFGDVPWRVVPIGHRHTQHSRAEPSLRLAVDRAGVGTLSMSLETCRLLLVGRYVELLFGGVAIAVRDAAAHSPNALVVSNVGQVVVTPFVTKVLGMRPGEPFTLATAIECGHAWGCLPDELIVRLRVGGEVQ